MPRVLGMIQPGDEGATGASLTASNAPGSGRPGKRPRGSRAAGAAAPGGDASKQQQQPGTGMHLRSAQKRLLAAEAAARTDSAVDSSQQLDRTDSCGGPDGSTEAAAAPGPVACQAEGQQQPPAVQKSGRQGQAEQSAQQAAAPASPGGAAAQEAAEAADEAAPEEQQPPKRRRISRTGVPPALPPWELLNYNRPSPPWRDDDENGHYQFEIGENLSPRFKIMRKFGEGTFGQVLECWDRQRKDYVAVKIIRNIQKYRDAAMIELEVLSTLSANDGERAKHCVRLLEWFNYREHVCMVFERLGPSLYDFLRRNSYRAFPLAMARSFVRQLLETVAFMHELELVHTDLKPENILAIDAEIWQGPPPASSKVGKRLPASDSIRVIDFGSATFDRDYHSSIVSTRHYRAPEIILGLGWSFPCDVWSVGCILVEFVTGDALFQTHENLEHLAMMEAVLGPLPPAMAAAAADGVRSLFRRGRLNWPDGAANKKSLKAVQRMKRLRDYLKQHGEEAVRQNLDVIADLVRRMLEYKAEDRITAAEALRHPFFSLAL